jgi:hypothetical protein
VAERVIQNEPTSDAIIGDLPIVIFLGDFDQFEPVKDTEETAMA